METMSHTGWSSDIPGFDPIMQRLKPKMPHCVPHFIVASLPEGLPLTAKHLRADQTVRKSEM